MKRVCWCMAMLLVLASPGWGQEAEQHDQQPSEQKPTLGPATPPSLYGARPATTINARRLLSIRTVFIERMDNGLGEKLADGLAKEGRFRMVTKRDAADAVLRGTCVDLRRLKSLHSEVYLTDNSGAAVWQDSVRSPFNPPVLDKAVTAAAGVIVEHLRTSILEAERK